MPKGEGEGHKERANDYGMAKINVPRRGTALIWLSFAARHIFFIAPLVDGIVRHASANADFASFFLLLFASFAPTPLMNCHAASAPPLFSYCQPLHFCMILLWRAHPTA